MSKRSANTTNRLAPGGKRGTRIGSRAARPSGLILAVVAALAVPPALLPAAAARTGPSEPSGPATVASYVDDPAAYVNPRIGNNGSGTTFPGAAVPFGMVQNSPDTRLQSYASYDYADNAILGFSQTHLSGVGCQTMGNIRLMPTAGAWPGTQPGDQASTFSHDNEHTEPGYYRVRLDESDIRAELSATERAGWHRYTYPAGTDQRNVVVNVGSSNGYTFGGSVEVVDDDTVEGWITGGNFCWETQKERYRVYFSAEFDQSFTRFGTWADGGGVVDGRRTTGISRSDGGAMLSFGPGDQPVGATVGISYTSVDGARANRVAESQDDLGQPLSFDQVRDAAADTWREQLSRIDVGGGSTSDYTTFYTALYHALLHPSIGSDVDGRYTGFDQQVHTSDHPYYQMFSLWDTYRAQNQMVALLEPQRATDMAKSILRVYEDGGWVPRWALGSGETNVMSGEASTPFITALYTRGLLDDATAHKLFDALWRNVNEVPEDQSIFRGRDGNPTYTENGWIGYQDLGGYQWGDTRQAGSATLEYALADCGLAKMAQGLGEAAKAAQLLERCTNFAHLWDYGIRSKGFRGFPRSRAADSSWVGSPDPMQSRGFHEGTAWQYQWLTQQNPPALFKLMGGTAQAESRLDTFYDMPTLLRDHENVARKSWVIGAYDYNEQYAFNPNNEPDLHSPWMYAWTDSPWKTSAVMRAARPLFTDGVYGMPGNDDLGSISSWLAFSMIGVFEVMPGSGEYVISAPMFDSVRIQPNGGAPVEIHAPGADASTLQYVDSVQVGADAWEQSWITHDDLLGAGTIRIALTDNHKKTDWGTGRANQPPTYGSLDREVFPLVAADYETPVIVKRGGSTEARIGAMNLSDRRVHVDFTVDAPPGLSVAPTSGRLDLPPNDRATKHMRVTVSDSAPVGVHAVRVAMTDAATGDPVGTAALAVKVPTPPHSGEWMYYSGMRNNMDATLTRTVSVPSSGTTTMSGWLLYETESNFDYIYGEVSTDGGATWQQLGERLDGASGGWREVSRDLTPYAGQDVQFRWRYSTDGGVLERGVYADDFALTNDGSVVWSDDVEAGAAGWEIAEFHPVDYALLP